jgi:translation initiation factor IF-3
MVPPAARTCFEETGAISTNFRHNHQIRISPIRLIDHNDNQVGITSTSDALKMAHEAGLDLVEVAPTAKPPVCRIMDYGKWRYQQQKKEDKSRASNKGGRLKMLNIDTIRIGDHDLEIKVNRARDFLKEGNKVQFTLRFKGREMAHLDLGRDLMNKVKAQLWPVSKVERDAKMEGRRMTLVLQPDHKQPGAKPPVPQAGNRPMGMTAGSGLNIPARPPMGGPVGPRPVGSPGVAGAPAGAARPAPAPAAAPAPAPAAAPRPPVSPPAAAPRPVSSPTSR